MKTMLQAILPVFFLAPLNKPANPVENSTPSFSHVLKTKAEKDKAVLNFQDPQTPGKMRSVEFKYQEYCRAEMPPDFEFDVRFKVVSATVYFSGANFRGVEKGTISSNSLKPIKPLMERCIPGTMVVFDDVKVIGPDNKVRSIAGLSLLLY